MTQAEQRTVVLRAASKPRVEPAYPSLSEEALGQLKMAWRLAHVEDDWTKGGTVSDAWDRWATARARS
jgi:hypothetical protein